MAVPVITAVTSPVAAGNQVRVIGTNFGQVSSCALVNDVTGAVVNTPDFIVDHGQSIHLTVPKFTPVGFYYVSLGTLLGEHSTNMAGLVNVTLTPLPYDPLPDLIPQGTTLARIRARLRIEIADYIQSFTVAQKGDGTSNRFDLPAESVVSESVVAYYVIEGETVATPLVLNTDFIIESKTGIITTTLPIRDDATLYVRGTYAQFFTDAELDIFIESAFAKHTHGATDRVITRNPLTGRTTYVTNLQTYASLPVVEEHPVALLASIEALWALAADTSYDIDVTTAEGTNLPRQQRYHAIMQMIEAQQTRYDGLAAKLNVGLGRIEMFTLRRISRTTGRYVPVYVGREYDEHGAPIRVYPPVDTGVTGSGDAQRTYIGQQYPPGP